MCDDSEAGARQAAEEEKQAAAQAAAAAERRLEEQAAGVKQLEQDMRLMYHQHRDELELATQRYQDAAARCTLLLMAAGCRICARLVY